MLAQMGTIKSTKDKSLAVGVLNQAKGKNKSKDLKQKGVKEKKHPYAEISSSTDEDSKAKRMKVRERIPNVVIAEFHIMKYISSEIIWTS